LSFDPSSVRLRRLAMGPRRAVWRGDEPDSYRRRSATAQRSRRSACGRRACRAVTAWRTRSADTTICAVVAEQWPCGPRCDFQHSMGWRVARCNRAACWAKWQRGRATWRTWALRNSGCPHRQRRVGRRAGVADAAIGTNGGCRAPSVGLVPAVDRGTVRRQWRDSPGGDASLIRMTA
jgi:hypothetical protein